MVSTMSRYEGQETLYQELVRRGDTFPRGRKFYRHDLVRMGVSTGISIL